MKDIYSYAMKLVRYVLCGNATVSDENTDFEKLFEFAKYHSIESMIYVGLCDSGTVVPKSIMTKLKEIYNGAIVFDTMQDMALREISNEFENAGIDYIPLKGSLLKNYYPMPDYRKSGDIDILIKPEDEPEVIRIMEKLDYRSVEEFEAHDIHLTYQKEPYLTIEIHRQLVRNNNRAYPLCSKVWDNVSLAENTKHRYNMNAEFLYVYLIAHLAKHIYSGGAGIRLITDIWVMREKFVFDNEKLNRYLQQADLVEINNMIIKLTERMFKEDINTGEDENISLLESIVIDGGSFGSDETRLIIDSNKDYKSRTKRIIGMIFPPAKALLTKYPVLKKHAFLLPFIWIYRAFRLLIYKRERVSKKMKNSLDISKKNSAFDEIINAVCDK